VLASTVIHTSVSKQLESSAGWIGDSLSAPSAVDRWKVALMSTRLAKKQKPRTKAERRAETLEQILDAAEYLFSNCFSMSGSRHMQPKLLSWCGSTVGPCDPGIWRAASTTVASWLAKA
jgi:hypothetical protein